MTICHKRLRKGKYGGLVDKGQPRGFATKGRHMGLPLQNMDVDVY